MTDPMPGSGAFETAPVVVTVGCFDLLHRGHVQLFQRMRAHGPALTVLVHDDVSIFENKGRFPVQTLDHRMANLRSIGIECVLPVWTADPTGALEQVWNDTPHFVYVRGDDWPDFPGRPFLETVGIRVVLLPYTEGVSTTLLRERL